MLIEATTTKEMYNVHASIMYTVLVVGFVIGNLLTTASEYGRFSDDCTSLESPRLLSLALFQIQLHTLEKNSLHFGLDLQSNHD